MQEYTFASKEGTRKATNKVKEKKILIAVNTKEKSGQKKKDQFRVDAAGCFFDVTKTNVKF